MSVRGEAAEPQPLSLRARLLLVSALVLVGFVALTGLALDRAFRESADTAQQARLEALLYLLMGSLDVAADGSLSIPAQVPEARLALPASGLYAAIARIDADPAAPEPRPPTHWRSASTVGLALALGDTLAPGQSLSEVRRAAAGESYRVLARGVRWEIGDTPSLITFSVAAPLAARGADIASYRHALWSALALMALLLLGALTLVQRWGLRPVRRLARRLAAMEAGEARELGGRYPRELAPLARNLDRLLERERALLERHRKALGDLAHSLKTPLAVLRSAPDDAALAQQVREQAARMDEIVNYQLQRAATAGASRLAEARPLAPLVERRLASMAKVHVTRALALHNTVPAALAARIDEGDALELLGNLLDNACKWAATELRVEARRHQGGLLIVVEDDGPGIADAPRLLQRGLRGDERIAGHGIGLAIVHDIALAYGGSLSFARSALGGARVEVWLGQC